MRVTVHAAESFCSCSMGCDGCNEKVRFIFQHGNKKPAPSDPHRELPAAWGEQVVSIALQWWIATTFR